MVSVTFRHEVDSCWWWKDDLGAGRYAGDGARRAWPISRSSGGLRWSREAARPLAEAHVLLHRPRSAAAPSGGETLIRRRVPRSQARRPRHRRCCRPARGDQAGADPPRFFANPTPPCSSGIPSKRCSTHKCWLLLSPAGRRVGAGRQQYPRPPR
jgi:hypothetical protein